MFRVGGMTTGDTTFHHTVPGGLVSLGTSTASWNERHVFSLLDLSRERGNRHPDSGPSCQMGRMEGSCAR